MTKKVSIYDVAKYCHVSAASVSYVLNGKKKVSLETKRKILRAIDELGFVMDSSARALSTGRSHLIGLFLPLDDASVAFMQNPFYAELLGGLETGIADYDYDIVIGYQKNQNNFKDWVQSRGIDAIVMLGKYPKSVYEDIKKLHITAVLIDVYEEYGKELKPKMIVNSSMLAMQTLERGMGFCFISEVFLPYITNTKDIDFFCIGKTR